MYLKPAIDTQEFTEYFPIDSQFLPLILISVEVLPWAAAGFVDIDEWVEMSEFTDTWRSAPTGPLIKLSRRSIADSGEVAEPPTDARSGASDDTEGFRLVGVLGLQKMGI